jgi:multidrug efflux pump subunit AcrB
MVTLTALIISIGSMVDNSIVALDSALLSGKTAKSFRDAAVEGIRLVATSQLGGTITNVVMFLPLAILKGMSGQLFKPLALTMIFTFISSIVSAMTVVPLLFSRLKPQEKTDPPISRFLRRAQAAYIRFLPKTFRHKMLVVLVSILLWRLHFSLCALHMELIASIG